MSTIAEPGSFLASEQAAASPPPLAAANGTASRVRYLPMPPRCRRHVVQDFSRWARTAARLPDRE
jgi:hypothetical protein